MDQQQCGDMDDDDHDQKMAEKGDDKGINPERLEQEMEEEQALDADSDDENLEGLDEAGKKIHRSLQGKPAEVEEKDEEDQDQDQDQKEGRGEEDKPKKVSKKRHEPISIKISLAQKPAAAPATSLGKRAAAEAGDGAGQAAKKVKTEGGASGGIEARVRAAIQMDKEMSIKKLLNVLGVKKGTQEAKDEFMQVVKRICSASAP